MLEQGQLREQIVEILFAAAKKESSRISRCIALYLVGTMVFSELYSGLPSRRLPEGLDILLASLQASLSSFPQYKPAPATIVIVLGFKVLFAVSLLIVVLQCLPST